MRLICFDLGWLLEAASFEITRDAYELENNIGSLFVVRHRLQISFSEHVLVKCQQHRDSMDDMQQ